MFCSSPFQTYLLLMVLPFTNRDYAPKIACIFCYFFFHFQGVIERKNKNRINEIKKVFNSIKQNWKRLRFVYPAEGFRRLQINWVSESVSVQQFKTTKELKNSGFDSSLTQVRTRVKKKQRKQKQSNDRNEVRFRVGFAFFKTYPAWIWHRTRRTWASLRGGWREALKCVDSFYAARRKTENIEVEKNQYRHF